MSEASPKFRAASDEELRESGWDPASILEDPDREGPYAAARIATTCGHCGAATVGYTVVNLATATGIGREWADPEAETEAWDEAAARNGAWLEGFTAANRPGA